MAAAALGVSSNVFLVSLAHLTSPAHLLVYHFRGDPWAIFVPVIADVLILAAACFAMFCFLPERTMLHRVFWSCVLCIYPWIFIKNVCNVLRLRQTHVVILASLGLCTAACLLLAIVRTDTMNRIFIGLQKFGVTIFVASGIVGALTLFEATWFGFQARHLNHPSIVELVARPAVVTQRGHILWIVLDELGYRQLYERRLPGLQLPAFDQFRGESTVFTRVLPAGYDTEIVLPVLMTGIPVDRIKASPDGRLSVHDPLGWHRFDQQDTVFADADALGYRSAVVGWFNPYCRILPAVLDSCFWTNRSSVEGFLSNRGIGPNLVHSITILASRLPRFLGLTQKTLPTDVRERGEEHIAEFLELERATDAALSDSRNDFLLLHMPIPHPEGIWNRRSSQFAINLSSYVDNLALADDYLAHVRALLEASGQWDSTTVVLMGDHAWRTREWKDLPSWSREDQLASDGAQFDPRPAYVIKLPYQHTAAIVETAFPAVRTRSLLDELLNGHIATPAQLQQWAAADSNAPARTQAGGPAL